MGRGWGICHALRVRPRRAIPRLAGDRAASGAPREMREVMAGFLPWHDRASSIMGKSDYEKSTRGRRRHPGPRDGCRLRAATAHRTEHDRRVTRHARPAEARCHVQRGHVRAQRLLPAGKARNDATGAPPVLPVSAAIGSSHARRADCAGCVGRGRPGSGLCGATRYPPHWR